MKKLIILLPILLTGCFDYSEGDRVGLIQKLSRKGILCKTWEGEMMLGGLKNQINTDSEGKSFTSMTSNVFQFTVEDESLLPKIKEAMEAGKPVILTYKQELVTFCRSNSDGNYFITDIKIDGK